jgi:hypothetical protein
MLDAVWQDFRDAIRALRTGSGFGAVANNIAMSRGSFGNLSSASPYIFGAPQVIQMAMRLDFSCW